MTILDEITANKRLEVEKLKANVPLDYVKKLANGLKVGNSLKNNLLNSDSGIISEFKRKSPSLGYIYEHAQVKDITMSYQEAGCCGISVLTDFKYFGGNISDLKNARETVSCPILRKDFMVDPYQIYESKILGADVILLIASALSLDEAYDMGEIAHELGMEVLLEIHDESELDYISRFTDMVGVNNRNLKTFKTDIQTSFRLSDMIPSDKVKVSESGITDAETIKMLRVSGFRGFLVGEAFMKTSNPGKALADLISGIK